MRNSGVWIHVVRETDQVIDTLVKHTWT